MLTRTLKHSIKIQQNNLKYFTKKKRNRKTELVLRGYRKEGRTGGWGEEWWSRNEAEEGRRQVFWSYGLRRNWQQRLRQLRRYRVREIEGLRTWGIDPAADAMSGITGND